MHYSNTTELSLSQGKHKHKRSVHHLYSTALRSALWRKRGAKRAAPCRGAWSAGRSQVCLERRFHFPAPRAQRLRLGLGSGSTGTRSRRRGDPEHPRTSRAGGERHNRREQTGGRKRQSDSDGCWRERAECWK